MAGSSSLVRSLVLVVATLFVCAAMPLDAEAQGWSWIRKLSGPEFRTFEVFQASACIAGKRCVEGAVLPLGLVGVGAKLTGRNLFTDDHPAENEMQIGVLVEHAGDGENLERGIDDVDLWIIEPQWRLLLRSWVLPRPDPNRDGDSNWRVFPVVTVGLASYRFSGNDLDTFWTSAITPSLSGRVEYQYFFVQGGVKLHYFFDSLPSQYFGGTPEGDVPGTEYGFSAFVHAGFRFGGF